MLTTSQPFIYTLMPMGGHFDPIYQRGVKGACESIGAYVERNEKQIYLRDTLKQMNNQIKRAEIIVADLTGQSLDVFYGIGYALAMDKALIIIAQSNADIPEDLRKHTYVIYNKTATQGGNLQTDLAERIQYVMQTPSILEKAQFPLTFYINGQQLREDRPVEINYDLNNKNIVNGKSVFELQIDLNNKSNAHFTGLHQVGVITNEIFRVENNGKESIKLPNTKHLHLIPLRDTILPFSWETLQVTVGSYQTVQQLREHGHFRWLIRIFTEMGIIEYPIFIRLGRERREPVVGIYGDGERMEG